MLVPVSFAGTEFYFDGMRANDNFCIFSPWGNATVDIREGGALQQSVSVNSTTPNCVNQDAGETAATRINSTIPVLVVHDSTSIEDGFVFYPATDRDLYLPSASTNVFIAAGPDGANVTCTDDDGTADSATIAANDDADCNGVTTGGDGAGDAVVVTSTDPIGVIQQADGDGTESTIAVPLIEMSTYFGSVVDTEYVVFATPFDNTYCALYDGATQVGNTTVSVGGSGVGQGCFGCGADTTIATGPWTLQCNQSVWPYHEAVEAGGGEETNLFGYKQMRQYVYPEPVVSGGSLENYSQVITNASLFTWSSWFTETSGGQISSPDNQYLQYRVRMNTTDTAQTPTLDNLNLYYSVLTLDWANMQSSGTLLTTVSPFECGVLTGASSACIPELNISAIQEGNYSLRLRAVSDLGLEQTSEEINFTVNLQPVLIDFEVNTSVVAVNNTVELSVQMLDEASVPLAGYDIDFYDETGNGSRIVIGSATTAANGIATIPYTIPTDGSYGTHTLNASFPGDSSIFILDTNLTRSLTVSSTPVIVSVNLTPQIGFGGNLTIVANVSDAVGLSDVNISIVDNTGSSYDATSMNLNGGFYEYFFNDSWTTNEYNFTITGVNTDGVTATNTGQFNVSVRANIDYSTTSDNYANEEIVQINSLQTDWFYPYFERRIPINITTDTIINDLEVDVDLSSVGFIFSAAQTNGEDIRVTYVNGSTESAVSFFVEDYNGTSEQGILWIKTPYLDLDSESFYIYYGNSSVSSQSNASATFLFYDDFETFTGWSDQGSGSVVQSSVRSYRGGNSAHKINNNDPNGAFKLIGDTVGREVLLDFYLNRNGASGGGNYDRVGILNGSGDGYGWAYDHNGEDIYIDERSSFSPNNLGGSAAVDVVDAWVYAQFFIDADGSLTARRFNLNGSLIGSTTITSGVTNEFDRMYIFGGHDYWVDNMRLRKYTDGIISVEAGEQESGAFGVTNEQGVEFQAYLRMLTQEWNGVSWVNIIPPVIENQLYPKVKVVPSLSTRTVLLGSSKLVNTLYVPAS
jgi:hypothetical protein